MSTMAIEGKKVASRTIFSDEDRWDAVVHRDRAADGVFFYSVRTTGVYCRPSCGARLPRRENVAFHASCEDAERLGFRPCKRCRPDQPAREDQHAAAVAKACRLIEAADELPSLDQLAAAECSRFVGILQGGLNRLVIVACTRNCDRRVEGNSSATHRHQESLLSILE